MQEGNSNREIFDDALINALWRNIHRQIATRLVFILFSNFVFKGQEEMLEIGLLNIDDTQYNIDNDDDSRVDENGKNLLGRSN